ncbi:hypothetical protein ABGB12_11945 [Actinocorallia sp. B10E7]
MLAFAVTQPLDAGQVNAHLEEIPRRPPDHYTPDGRLRKEKVAVEAETARPGLEKPLERLCLEEGNRLMDLVDPHGPHTPDSTRHAAAHLAEVMRVLAYATQPASGGVEEPADVHGLLGELKTAARRLEQVIHQLARHITEEKAAGRLEVGHGPFAGDPASAASTTRGHLLRAAELAEALHNNLDRARQVTADMSTRREPSGE